MFYVQVLKYCLANLKNFPTTFFPFFIFTVLTVFSESLTSSAICIIALESLQKPEVETEAVSYCQQYKFGGFSLNHPKIIIQS